MRRETTGASYHKTDRNQCADAEKLDRRRMCGRMLPRTRVMRDTTLRVSFYLQESLLGQHTNSFCLSCVEINGSVFQ